MKTLADFEKYDRDRALFTETSILTTGKQDFYIRKFDRIGRRHIVRMETFNDCGSQVKVWQYMTDVCRAIKNGTLEVYVK